MPRLCFGKSRHIGRGDDNNTCSIDYIYLPFLSFAMSSLLNLFQLPGIENRFYKAC